MSFVLACLDVLFGLRRGVHDSNEIWISGEPVEVADLVLKHVILGLFSHYYVAMPNLNGEIRESRKDRDRTQ